MYTPEDFVEFPKGRREINRRYLVVWVVQRDDRFDVLATNREKVTIPWLDRATREEVIIFFAGFERMAELA